LAVNSFINFGIPGVDGARTPRLQPILTDRFRVVFYNFGNPGDTAPYDLTRAVKSIGEPSSQFGTWQAWAYMSQHKGITRPEWQDTTLRLFDDIDNEARIRVQQQLSKQYNFFDQTGSRAGENYMFEMDIDILSGGASAGNAAADPVILRKWCVVGCSLTSDDPGELTYDDSNPKETSVNIQFNNAICYDGEGRIMGSFDHGPEHDARSGLSSLGVGGAAVTA